MRIPMQSRDAASVRPKPILSRPFATPPPQSVNIPNAAPTPNLLYSNERSQTTSSYEPPTHRQISGPQLPSFLQEGKVSYEDDGLVSSWGAPNLHAGGMGSIAPPTSLQEETDEVPLLEELGIHPDHVVKRMKAVLFFYRLEHDFLLQCDLGGPLCIVIALGFCLLLSGKPTFGYIYGLGIVGCISTYLLLNLMGQAESIDLYRTMSILGYGLLPVVMLAAVSIILSLRSLVGTILSILCILWCTATASRFFETALRMQHQRFLVAYPIGLLYTCFVLITVF